MPQESEAIANAEVRDPAAHDLVIRRAHVFDGLRALPGCTTSPSTAERSRPSRPGRSGAYKRWTRPKGG